MAEAVTQAAIARAMTQLEKAGTPVKAVRLYPDGSIALLTELAGEALPAHLAESWVEAAGGAEAGRA